MEILLNFKNKIIIILIILISTQVVNADSHNIYEVLEIIKKDLKTLEKAVYSNGLSDESNEDNQLQTINKILFSIMTMTGKLHKGMKEVQEFHFCSNDLNESPLKQIHLY